MTFQWLLPALNSAIWQAESFIQSNEATMRLQDINWMDVERYLQTDNRIILITGATEQHAYLSLLTDILIPSKIALAVAEREKVLIAPPFNFGQSEHFTTFPGTISISKQAFDGILTEIIQGLMY